MCGRFALTTPQTSVTELFDAVPMGVRDSGPRYNICPTQSVDVALLDEGERVHRQIRWGFLPRWYKAPNGGPLLINARSETIAEKPAFASSARLRRCLIPASGFYEWMRPDPKTRLPYYVSPADGGLMAFAGIWREWTDGAGMTLTTCAIVTCAANDRFAHIHHRLPVIIAPEDFGMWLGEEGKGAARLMHACEEDFLTFHRVSPAVNSNKGEGPALMAPVDEG